VTPTAEDRAKPWLLAVLALALALRIGFIFYLEPERIYFSDSIDYLRAAHTLVHEGEFGHNYKRPPLYPVFLAAVLAVGQERLVSVKIAEAIVGVLTVLLTYLLGKAVWGWRVGVTGAAFVAVHPYLFVLSGFLYSETIFTLLLLLATLVLFRARDVKLVALAGFLAGLACLAKPSALAFLAAGVIWILVTARWSWRRRAALSAVLVITGLLTIVPWLWRNYLVFGEVTPLDARAEVHLPYKVDGRFISKLEYFRTRKKKTKFVSHKDAAVDIVQAPGAYAVYVAGQMKRLWTIQPDQLQTANVEVRKKAAAQDARMLVKNHPAEKVQRFAWLFSVVLTPYYLLAFLGVWAGRAQLRKGFLFLLLILGYSFGYAMFFARLRYRLPIEPFVALFSAVGLWSLLGLIRRKDAGPSPAAPMAAPQEVPPLVTSRRG
jgi:4-amino-4-deoxy-L-arabinose transferase-like glycosyltransferase